MADKWGPLRKRAYNLRLGGIVFGVAAAVAALLVIVRLADDAVDPEIVDYFTGLAETALPFLLVAAVMWVGSLVLDAVIPSKDDD